MSGGLHNGLRSIAQEPLKDLIAAVRHLGAGIPANGTVRAQIGRLSGS